MLLKLSLYFKSDKLTCSVALGVSFVPFDNGGFDQRTANSIAPHHSVTVAQNAAS